MKRFTEEQKFVIEVVGHVLPFKVNNYVLDELIDWNKYEDDPMFLLTFPREGILSETTLTKLPAGLEKAPTSMHSGSGDEGH